MQNPPPKSVGGKTETNYFRLMDPFTAEVKNDLDSLNATVGGLPGLISTAVNSGTSPGSFSTLTTAEADVRHGTKTWPITPFSFVIELAADGFVLPTSASPVWSGSGIFAKNLDASIAIPIGEKIRTIRLFTKTGTNATLANRVWSFKVWKNVMTAAPSPVQIGSTVTGVGGVSAFETLTLSSLTEVITAGTTYWLNVITPDLAGAVDGAPLLLGAEVDTTRP